MEKKKKTSTKEKLKKKDRWNKSLLNLGDGYNGIIFTILFTFKKWILDIYIF